MGNSYKNCKIQDNTAELIYENGSLFVTIFENNIVHVAQKPGIESVAINPKILIIFSSLDRKSTRLNSSHRL